MSETKTGQQPTAANGAALWRPEYDELVPKIDLSELVTEDGQPVDNLYVERLYKLLTEPLYVSWVPPGGPGRPFVAMSNVGWFHAPREVTAPDVLVSLD